MKIRIIETIVRYIHILLLCMVVIDGTEAQLVLKTTIEELMTTAQQGSSAALVAKTRLENQYWRNVSFNAGFKPQLSFNAILPDISRTISSITLPSGEEAFVNRSFMNNSVGLQLFQRILKTGGSVFVRTDIERLDLFGTSTQRKSTSYLSNPISIGFTQPLFQFNQFKWDQELNDLEYKRAEKQYQEDHEMIGIEVVNRYFDLYITDLNIITAMDNQQYLDSLATTAEKRYDLGRIGETEMLQVKLSARNADALVSSLEQERQNKTELLRNYLGIQEEVIFELSDPEEISAYIVDKDKAISFANAHRSVITNFAFRLKNAQLELERANNANKPDVALTGRVGFTKSSPTFGGSFRGLNDQESVRLQLNIPIADWGRSRALRENAKSSLKLEKLLVKEEKIEFEREVALTVDQISLVRDRLSLAKIALGIASKRQDISKNRYQLGKQDATNLNIAIQEYSTAERSYYRALWEMWQIHYQLRFLTMFDFQKSVLLHVD